MSVTMSATPVYNQALDRSVQVREYLTSKQLSLSFFCWELCGLKLTMPWKLAFLEL